MIGVSLGSVRVRFVSEGLARVGCVWVRYEGSACINGVRVKSAAVVSGWVC